MSGHSKWSQIKRQKGVSDVKRGQTFTKLSNAITLAVKQGGGVVDPNQNFKLRLIIEKARGVNMPKENIERAIKRASGKEANEVSEVLYEGFGPEGAAIIVEAVTDNKLRTTSEVKNIIDKSGGVFGKQGSVSYQFEKVGQISISDFSGKSMDEIFLDAADSGAEDIMQEENRVIVFTKTEDLAKVRDQLLAKNIVIEEASLVWKPTIYKEVSEEDAEKIAAFIDKLDSLDDVQKVYTNVVVKE